MKAVFRLIGGAGLLLCLVVPLAQGAEPSFGQREFAQRCAMCHGITGRGDGWLAESLIHPPPMLTQLKKKNGGTFPRERVAGIIDGRISIKTHGPSEMPAWGTIYKTELSGSTGARRG